jgi:hypothetical protein
LRPYYCVRIIVSASSRLYHRVRVIAFIAAIIALAPMFRFFIRRFVVGEKRKHGVCARCATE